MIEKIIKKINPRKNSDPELIIRAFEFARQAHGSQKRAAGEPYITHPLAVAEIIADLKLDSPTIAAALLHDVLEDTAVIEQELEKKFGSEVAFLVKGVTKLARLEPHGQSGLQQAQQSQDHLHAQYLRRMFFAMAEDIRVILIKLADRYHNLITIQALPVSAQHRIGLETLEIYGPIAERLGMGQMKGDLEDLAFPLAYPPEHRWLMDRVKDRYLDRQRYLARIQPLVVRLLTEHQLKIVDAHSRAKHHYSLYKKLAKRNFDLNLIYDLVALRVILPTVSDCYEALGVIHKKYKPLPGLIKDYIALPKPNGYRSIHTTIFAEKGRILEIQLRTPEMHEHAENGIAAHWSYSESGKVQHQAADIAETRWVAQLKDWLKDPEKQEWYRALRTNFFSDRIFVFTPRGEIKDLPESSTPLDFAYAIHTDLGHATKGAKVNGKLVTLDYPLRSGEVVDVIKKRIKQPSADWLRIVRTSEARKKIQSWFRQNEEQAKEIEKTAPQIRSSPLLHPLLTTAKTTPALAVASSAVKEFGEVLTTLAKCCSPLPGDKILGYISRYKGVSVHQRQCPNLARLATQKLVKIAWPSKTTSAPWKICLTVKDKIGLLEEIGQITKKLAVNILQIKNNPPQDGTVEIFLTVEVQNSHNAQKLIQALKKNPYISAVRKI